ncbi:MAG: amidohydrolase, partial [Bacteroidetes bacterium]|nr:amidohydrolase [Bacteroidota bacterium]
MVKDEIKQLAAKNFKTVVDVRRQLHAHPELSFCEYETSAYVKARLDEMDIEWIAMANTGIVALIKGEKPGGSVIALRADMDALSITEGN